MKERISLLLVLPVLFFSACNNDTNNTNANVEKNDTMKSNITEKPFGNYNEEAITQYTLTNPSGMQVSIINYGGTVTEITTPDKDGNKGNAI
ncbi:MAG: galactose-1-epimerase, partial [Bacteroidota bacterium]|nr:galactose-1-epimerase [Bacteroidota bacterium]